MHVCAVDLGSRVAPKVAAGLGTACTNIAAKDSLLCCVSTKQEGDPSLPTKPGVQDACYEHRSNEIVVQIVHQRAGRAP